VAGWIILCSGGLGFFLQSQEFSVSQVFTDSTLTLTQDGPTGLEVNSLIPSMIFPQRAFTLGFPVGLSIFLILLVNFWRIQPLVFPRFEILRKRKTLVVAGIFAGLLPIIHTHTFLVIFLFSAWSFLFSYKNFKEWMYFAIPAAILSLFCYITFLSKSVYPSTFFSYNPWWLSQDGLFPWLLFWWKNWGVFGPLAIIGMIFLWRKKSKTLFLFSLFFFLLFIVSNVLQFQPQVWDNTKMFAWSYIGLSVAVVETLRLVHKHATVGISHAIVGILLFCLMISGGLDVIHTLDAKTKTFRMLSSEELTLASWVRSNTPPDAVFLTAFSVTNPVSMAGGRSVLSGHPGWAYSYGLPHLKREEDIKNMLKNPSYYLALFDSLSVNYVMIGPAELEHTPDVVFFESVFSEK
jgi:hypothetical protein